MNKIKLEGSDILEMIKMPTLEEIEKMEKEEKEIAKLFEDFMKTFDKEIDMWNIFIEDEDGICEGTHNDLERAIYMAHTNQLKRFVEEGWLFYEDGIISIERK